MSDSAMRHQRIRGEIQQELTRIAERHGLTALQLAHVLVQIVASIMNGSAVIWREHRVDLEEQDGE